MKYASWAIGILNEIQILILSLTDLSGKNITFLLSSIIIGDLLDTFINLLVIFNLSFKEKPKKQQELLIIFFELSLIIKD